jgi:hypothetical protein
MTSLGAFRGTVDGLGIELGLDPKDIRQVFDQLFRKNLVKVDERAFLFWCPNFLKYNTPENPNVVKGWFQALEMLPECPLLAEVVSCAIGVAREKFPSNNSVLDACKSLERVISSLSKDLGEDISQSLPQLFRKQEQEQEQEKEYIEDAQTAETEKPKSAKRSRTELAATMAKCPEGVNPDAWSAFLSNRKKKSMSEYALQLMQKECDKAGWTLADAIDLCVRKTWEGFDSEWVKNMPKPAKRTTLDAEKERKAAELRKEYEERAKRFESANDESDLLAAIGG